MEYTNVNFIYALVSANNNIYDMSTDFEEIENECNSYNNLDLKWTGELPFRVIEIDLDTKITF